MAKKKKAAPTEEFPSGEILAQLKALTSESVAKRTQAAWQLMLSAQPNSDFPVVMDFAQENGLVQTLDGAGSELKNGQRTPEPCMARSDRRFRDDLDSSWSFLRWHRKKNEQNVPAFPWLAIR